MKVLIAARKVRQRNILQQSLRRRVDLRNRVAGVGLQGKGALVAGLKICTVPARLRRCRWCLGEVSLPFQQRRHRRKLIERIFAALAVVVDEIKSLARRRGRYGEYSAARRRNRRNYSASRTAFPWAAPVSENGEAFRAESPTP